MSSTNLTDFRNQYLAKVKGRLTSADITNASDTDLILQSALLKAYDAVNRFDALGPDAGIDYWRQWYLAWDAAPGRHSLSVRATDLLGELQPEGRTTPFPEGARGWHTIVVTID